jgi:hypothetical protein
MLGHMLGTDPAMPSSDPDAKKGDPNRYVQGVNIRTYMATRIAEGLCACPHMVRFDDAGAWFRMTPAQVADQALAITDAIIARLSAP